MLPEQASRAGTTEAPDPAMWPVGFKGGFLEKGTEGWSRSSPGAADRCGGGGHSSSSEHLQAAAPLFSQGPRELSTAITVSWARRQRHREVAWLVWGHTAGGRQSGLCRQGCGPRAVLTRMGLGRRQSSCGAGGESEARDLLCNLSGDPCPSLGPCFHMRKMGYCVRRPREGWAGCWGQQEMLASPAPCPLSH